MEEHTRRSCRMQIFPPFPPKETPRRHKNKKMKTTEHGTLKAIHLEPHIKLIKQNHHFPSVPNLKLHPWKLTS